MLLGEGKAGSGGENIDPVNNPIDAALQYCVAGAVESSLVESDSPPSDMRFMIVVTLTRINQVRILQLYRGRLVLATSII